MCGWRQYKQGCPLTLTRNEYMEWKWKGWRFFPALFQASTFSGGGEPTKEGKERASTQLEWLNKAWKDSKSLCLSRTSTFLASSLPLPPSTGTDGSSCGQRWITKYFRGIEQHIPLTAAQF